MNCPFITQESPAGRLGSVKILLVFYFPVGIPLMILKLHKDKSNCVVNGNRVMTFGWFLIFFGTIIFFMGKLDSDEDAVFIILMSFAINFVGLFLLMHGNKYKKLGIRYERYVTIIFIHFNSSLERIAELSSKPYEKVYKELQKMIDMGFFPDCYIDLSSKTFVSPELIARLSSEQRSWNRNSVQRNNQNQERVNPSVTVCPNCGSSIEGNSLECEYCGSILR